MGSLISDAQPEMLLLLFAFISCSSACKVAKVQPKEIHVKLGQPFGFICTADSKYKWCTLKHENGRMCEFEWRRTYRFKEYNVSMNQCDDFQGRVQFKGNYSKHECGLTVAAATAEDDGVWGCRIDSYVKRGRRGDGYISVNNITVFVEIPTTTATTTTTTKTTTKTISMLLSVFIDFMTSVMS